VTPRLYRQYFVDKGDERRDLFRLLADTFGPKTGLYPGSFVHVTPSFFIESMVYVDSDRRIRRFFEDPALRIFIDKNKEYPGPPTIDAHQGDFTGELPLADGSFDIMFSLYSGFISRFCKRYLKSGGVLLANNSHGDASLASLDEDFEFVGAVHRRAEAFRLQTEGLEGFFKTKNGRPIDREKVLRTMVGEGFTRTAYGYLFRKTD